MAHSWLDLDRADFLPLAEVASAQELSILESRGLQHVERFHKTREEIDLATAGRCVALGLAKDISRASSHLELHRSASGSRDVYYGKVVLLVVLKRMCGYQWDSIEGIRMYAELTRAK